MGIMSSLNDNHIAITTNKIVATHNTRPQWPEVTSLLDGRGVGQVCLWGLIPAEAESHIPRQCPLLPWNVSLSTVPPSLAPTPTLTQTETSLLL